ncbi:MAG: 50S ribosomal protein L29 [Deltaproteobacteria bacterium]|nr:50S ribosomal protein L29 [Deltaproteobacteria bacterium]
MKYEEIKNSSKDELIRKNGDLRAELFGLHVKNKTAQLENKSRIRLVRRDIARVQTRLTKLSDGKQS